MPAPLSRIEQLIQSATEALRSRDWASLHFNAQLMRKETPESPLPWSYLGIALVQQGLEQRSEALIQRGIECHLMAAKYGPNDTLAIGNLGFMWVKLSRYEEALKVLTPATVQFPDDTLMWGYRAQAELGAGLLSSANHSVARLLQLVDKAQVVLPLDRLYLAGGVIVPLAQPLSIGVGLLEGGEVACEESDFELFGVGGDFSAALTELCEYFTDLVEEYVNTDDPLDPGAEELARRLREHLGPDFSTRMAGRAG